MQAHRLFACLSLSLLAIAEPGRAMVYASPDDFKPSVYAELEFSAYGPERSTPCASPSRRSCRRGL